MQLDHFIFGVPNLEAARAEFQRETGVMPQLGGQHPTLGTHNALVSLGDSYFELLARDVSLNVPENDLLPRLARFSSRHFFGWALQTHDFSEVAQWVSGAGLSVSPVGRGSRLTPDGNLLRYEFAEILGLDEPVAGVLPFIVKWIDTVHPSVSAPAGCRLKRIELRHVPSPKLKELLRTSGVDLAMTESAENRMILDLTTPMGDVRI